jgi:hypothetical protein
METKTNKFEIHKGDSIWFEVNKKPFRVRECNDRFAICTQPFNFKPKTVIYTIIDFDRNVRGEDNLIFSVYDYYSDEDCKNAMEDLMKGEIEVSYKKNKHTTLDIVNIKHYKNNGI